MICKEVSKKVGKKVSKKEITKVRQESYKEGK